MCNHRSVSYGKRSLKRPCPGKGFVRRSNSDPSLTSEAVLARACPALESNKSKDDTAMHSLQAGLDHVAGCWGCRKPICVSTRRLITAVQRHRATAHHSGKGCTHRLCSLWPAVLQSRAACLGGELHSFSLGAAAGSVGEPLPRAIVEEASGPVPCWSLPCSQVATGYYSVPVAEILLLQSPAAVAPSTQGVQLLQAEAFSRPAPHKVPCGPGPAVGIAGSALRLAVPAM